MAQRAAPRRLARAVVGKLRAGLQTLVDGPGQALWLDYLVGRLEHRQLRPVNAPFERYRIDGPVPDVTLVIATSRWGLLLYEAGTMRRLIGGSGYYGVTRGPAGRWYAFHKTGLRGRVLSFRLAAGQAADVRCAWWGLSPGVHQIDFIDAKRLVVTDTYHNALLTYRPSDDHRARFWRPPTGTAHPAGRTSSRHRGPSYRHFNSVFRRDDHVYVIAHNETSKTGRTSELYVLDTALALQRVTPLAGANCHNYYLDDSGALYCASMEGTLRCDEADVLDLGLFTRGLSVADDYLAVGGSPLQHQRSTRNRGEAHVVVAQRDFTPRGRIVIADTQVQEIRRVDRPDLALSLSG